MDTIRTCTALSLQHGECVVEATKQIFNAVCGVNVETLADERGTCEGGLICAAIPLVGDIDWSVFLGLPRQTATAAAARFAGFEVAFESEDMGDAVGELTNILAGKVKVLLDKRGVSAEMYLPSVIRAASLASLARKWAPMSKICFNTELGKLWTGVTIGRPRLVATAGPDQSGRTTK